MNLKLSIQKQKHFNSLIIVRDLGLTISIKSSNSPAEKEHGGVFSLTVVILFVAYIYIKDMPWFHFGTLELQINITITLGALCVYVLICNSELFLMICLSKISLKIQVLV